MKVYKRIAFENCPVEMNLACSRELMLALYAIYVQIWAVGLFCSSLFIHFGVNTSRIQQLLR